MPTRLPTPLASARRVRHQAQQRAVWDFAAKLEDWRCKVCLARVDYDDRELFDRTHLCATCSEAVNEALVWRNSAVIEGEV